MKKSAGPRKRREVIPLADCKGCDGKGAFEGIFYEIRCDQCLGSGYVDKRTGDAIPPLEVVAQLRMELNEALKELARAGVKKGDGRGYGENASGFGLGGRRYHGD